MTEKVKTVSMICPRCRGRMFEEETYFELGVKKIELGCYTCPKKIYTEYKKYKNYIKDRVAGK